MPKGKGLSSSNISGAFRSDLESLSDRPETVDQKVEQSEERERISITIPAEMLRVINRYIFEQKERGVSVNRSSFITEALEPVVRELEDKK